jgi:hypothetical protein
MSLSKATRARTEHLLGRLGAEGATLKTELDAADDAHVTDTAALATAVALKASVATTLQALLDTTPTLPNLRTGCDAAIAALTA